MSDIRTKLLGLAALAMAFAGMSYGQVACVAADLPAGVTAQATNPTAPILDRAESETELVSDFIANCYGSTLTTGGQLTVFMSLPVTSKAIATVAPANSEAILQVQSETAGGVAIGAPVVYNGTVGGSVVTFTGVTFPANFQATISNIRVNATAAGATSSPIAVTENVFAGTNGLATLVESNTVGYVLKSLATPAFTLNAIGFPDVAQYTVCQGNAVSVLKGFGVGNGAPGFPSFLGPGESFIVTVGEVFGGAFKLQFDATGNLVNEEQGSYPHTLTLNPPSGIGGAASGTEISLTFANVPSAATIYLPLSVTNGFLTLSLTGNPTVATSPAGLVGPSIEGPGGPVAFTPSSGTVTATYQVTATNAASVENVNIPAYITFAANSVSAQGPITVLEAYAPAATLTGQATSVPTFAPSTATPLNGSAISICQTTLLFPYVTNGSGYETGIAIANTTTDNLGNFISPTGSTATPTPGTCKLNFYGDQAQPAQVTVPKTGNIGAWTSTIPGQSPVYADTLSDLISPATGFTGYAIANCNFLDAHGFAFILDATGTGAASGPEGYLAVVLPRATTAGGGADGGDGQ